VHFRHFRVFGVFGVCRFCLFCILSFSHFVILSILLFSSFCCFVDFAVFMFSSCVDVVLCCVDVRLPPDLAFSVFFSFAFLSFSIYPACIRIEGIGQETCRYDPSLRAGRACGYVIYALHFPDFMTCLRW
jgi:hypothetical protein